MTWKTIWDAGDGQYKLIQLMEFRNRSGILQSFRMKIDNRKLRLNKVVVADCDISLKELGRLKHFLNSIDLEEGLFK